jgi:hypothetical protein
MTVRLMAECEGPTCNARVPVEVDYHPVEWIVVEFHSVGTPPQLDRVLGEQTHGFCSPECLAAWAAAVTR